MFETRLKLLLFVLGGAGLILVARLFQLQAVQADYYRKRSERAVRLEPEVLPFVRGAIRDRTGEILVADEPSWDVRVDFAVLAADVGVERDRSRRFRNWTRRHRFTPAFRSWKGRHQSPDRDTLERAFRTELHAMWMDMAAFSGPQQGDADVEVLQRRAREIYDRVLRIHQIVSDRRGFPTTVKEENIAHALITGLDAHQQIEAREVFARYPWVHVVPSSRRRATSDGAPFAHVLGRLGRVDAQVVSSDPNVDDPFARYLASEWVGVSGVEYVAEGSLRGRRGQMTIERDESLIELIEPQHGRDAYLAIHAELQRRLYLMLGDAVSRIPESPGGAIVVLDVSTRETLAMVSFPSYDPNRFSEEYAALRDDTRSLPLRFRAVSNQYAPGSTIKPLVCLAGLMSGQIDLDTRFNCSGYLNPQQRTAWRCWKIHGTSMRMAHGSVDVVEALTGSCNIFMYRLGEAVGVDRLCNAFEMAGIGRSPGLGLREEAVGVNPTSSWLATYRHTAVFPAHARNFAIGQGELLVTPVQLANLMATYASGRYRPLTLVGCGREKPEWRLPVSDEQWRAVRKGIYGVVNDPHGTARKFAHLQHDRYVLCGKTGSATAHPWPTAYDIPYVNEYGEHRIARVPAGASKPAIKQFVRKQPKATFDPSAVTVARRWPPEPPVDGGKHSHAWFGGYLQKVDGLGDPDWSQEPRIAFAVLVEFGGSGGRTTGPLAKEVARVVIEVFGKELEIHHDHHGGKGP